MDLTAAFASDAEIEALALGLFARTLPKPQWTHRAHFASALYVIVKRPDLDASVALPPAIRDYNESTGVANTDTGGYHETITQASIRAARAFASGTACALYEICNELMRSRLGKSDWLLAYWSRETLFSIEARRTWIDADLRPFPF